MKSSELMLPYDQFGEFLAKTQATRSPEDHEWLYRWYQLDLAISPMDDTKRAAMRYGHYLGWFDRKSKREEVR